MSIEHDGSVDAQQPDNIVEIDEDQRKLAELATMGYAPKAMGKLLNLNSQTARKRMYKLAGLLAHHANSAGVTTLSPTGMVALFTWGGVGCQRVVSQQWQDEFNAVVTGSTRKFLTLVTQGESNSGIATELGISTSSVGRLLYKYSAMLERFAKEAHVAHTSRTGLATMCALAGIVAKPREQSIVRVKERSTSILNTTQLRVVKLVAQAYSNREIAKMPGLDPGIVKSALDKAASTMQRIAKDAGIVRCRRIGLVVACMTQDIIEQPSVTFEWKTGVNAVLTDADQAILTLLLQGLTDEKITAVMGLRDRTTPYRRFKAIAEKLERFAVEADVVRVDRTGLAVISLLAGITPKHSTTA